MYLPSAADRSEAMEAAKHTPASKDASRPWQTSSGQAHCAVNPVEPGTPPSAISGIPLLASWPYRAMLASILKRTLTGCTVQTPHQTGMAAQAFMNSAKGGLRMQPLPGPPLPLSQSSQCRIRDRSTIVARHLFADRGEAYADSQVQPRGHESNQSGTPLKRHGWVCPRQSCGFLAHAALP